MTGLGEDVYTDRSAALDELAAESQRMGLYGDAPDNAVEAMVEAAARAVTYAHHDSMGVPEEFAKDAADNEWVDFTPEARAALESLGVPLSVLAAIRAGEWQAVPKEPTCGPERGTMSRAGAIELSDVSMRTAVRVYRAMLSAAPKTPEAAR